MSCDDFIIIKTDGGICSQIAFWSLGILFEKKGYKVKYDLSFFVDDGMGIDGVSQRNYILEKLFHEVEFDYASEDEIKNYRQNYYVNNPIDVSNIKPPAYIDGYPPARELSVYSNLDVIKKYLNPILDSDDVLLRDHIISNKICGVHCRRGDIAATFQSNDVYGKPVSLGYFVDAINFIQNIAGDVEFMFFSDSPDWVEKELLPLLSDKKCTVIDKHDQDKGYVDLYLMSLCKYMIGSNGSMSYYSKMLSNSPDVPIVICKPVSWLCENCDNVFVFNQRECIKKYSLTSVVPMDRYKHDIELERENSKIAITNFYKILNKSYSIKCKRYLYGMLSFICPISIITKRFNKYNEKYCEYIKLVAQLSHNIKK